MPDRTTRLLSELEKARYRFGRRDAARAVKLLRQLARTRFASVASLIRFHEALLFLRAFPHSAAVARAAEQGLRGMGRRVAELRHSGADMEEFDPLEVSGIAGTEMADTLSFDVLRWLVRHAPGAVEIDWENYSEERAMGAAWPRWIPLLEEDACVEASIPWRRWLETAGGDDAAWLVERVEGMRLAGRDAAEIYDAMRVPVRWKVGDSRWSRTLNWDRPRQLFLQREPLIARNQVSLAEELARPAPALAHLSRAQGGRVTDRIREIMLVRYRELYGTTLADPASVRRADVGRGVSIFFWNLPADRRLPLRAYTAGFTLKNGVPINYIEAIGLCEWIEVGFNTFYTFRGGEAAWIYAQVLRCLHALMGAQVISVYPYQIGQNNDEALDSGAFWFYRKLGFRPGRREALRLAEREERRIGADPEYRTPRGSLRRLADSHVFYELPGTERGAWDTFSTRNLGLRAAKRMAREFSGDSARLRRAAAGEAARRLGTDRGGWSAAEKRAFEDFALVLTLDAAVARWTPEEKRLAERIIRAKAAPDEMKYLRLMQRHPRLRRLLLRLGSAGPR